MAEKAQVLVAAAGAGWESPLLPILAAPTSPVRLARRCVDLPDLVAAAAAGRGSLVLVSSRIDGWDADVVARLGECQVATLVVAEDPVDAERSRRLGVDRVLPADLAADPPLLLQALLDAADDVIAVPTTPVVDVGVDLDTAAPDRNGQVVAVWGPTGAPGRSTVALGVAAAAARQQISTVLIDADVYGGATGQMLAVLDEVSGVLSAVRAASAGTLDRPAFAAAARTIGPHLRVLTGLPRADRWTALRPAAIRELLTVARASAQLVVVDCGFCIEQDDDLAFDTAAPRRNGATTAVLEHAEMVLAVGSADPLGLTRLARARSDLRELVPTAAVRLVVNKVRRGLCWSRDEVSATLLRAIGEVPLAYLPHDLPAVDHAWTNGQAVGESSSALGLALEELCTAVGVELGLDGTASVGRRGRRRSRTHRAVVKR
ncbi:MAG: chromosome partitioning protein [Nocardioidaceae bacterium]|nr:chromosome partitioning protein [Nocardioidaceae bacterium]